MVTMKCIMQSSVGSQSKALRPAVLRLPLRAYRHICQHIIPQHWSLTKVVLGMHLHNGDTSVAAAVAHLKLFHQLELPLHPLRAAERQVLRKTQQHTCLSGRAVFLSNTYSKETMPEEYIQSCATPRP